MPSSSFASFLQSLDVHPLLKGLSHLDYVALDLSIHNAQLKQVDVSASKALGIYITNFIKTHKAKSAFGGYLEQRGIYHRSAYFNPKKTNEERNIHLGIDLWIAANTPIFAPLEAIIHSFNNNTNFGDYGPTIILEHHIGGYTFYTLYGHLSLASITNLKVGETVSKGEQIATLGTAEVNGDYPPHLHFQIIKDMQNYKGDYPGVSNALDLEFYKQNCPDPNLLLGLG